MKKETFATFLKKRIYFMLIPFCLNLSCSKTIANKQIKGQESSDLLVAESKEFVNIPESALSVVDYLDWVKAQKGITYSEIETKETQLSILYRPLKLESALSTNPNSKNKKSEYKANLENKKDYHYFLLECLNKVPHAANGNKDQKRLLSTVKNNLFVILNQSDTVHNPIVEEFLSQILNQPSQLLVLIPKDKSIKNILAGVKGDSLGINTIKINITKKQLESLPEIKL